MVKNRVSVWVAFEEEEDSRDYNEQDPDYDLEISIEEALTKIMGHEIHVTIKTVTYEDNLQSSFGEENPKEAEA